MVAARLVGSRARCLLAFQEFRELADDIIAPVRRHQVDALDHAARGSQQLLRLAQTLLMAMLPGGAHPRSHALRNADARYLVMQVFGVARTMQRDTAKNERHRWLSYSVEEA